MMPIAAIVTFGIPEREVDALIEGITGTPAEPARWLVFGSDMNLLEALNQQWCNLTDLVLVLLPGTDSAELDAALLILEHEGLEPRSVVWLHGMEVAAEPPPAFRDAFRIPKGILKMNIQQLIQRLVDKRFS